MVVAFLVNDSDGVEEYERPQQSDSDYMHVLGIIAFDRAELVPGVLRLMPFA